MATKAPTRLLARQFAQLECKTVASTSKKPFSSTARPWQESFDDILTADSPTISKAATIPPFPSSTPAASTPRPSVPTARPTGFRGTPPASAPYRLHAHCSKHNTILSLTRDLPKNSGSVQELYRQLEGGTASADQGGAVDSKIYGQTVLRSSCGTVGFKKGQRSSFEAATRASNQMFTMIEQLGRKERKTKVGQRVIDPEPTEIELVLKGFGQGREAVFAALQTDAGKRVKNMIRRVTDATPIKIGGTRPRKRRNVGYSDPNRGLRF